MARWVRAPTLLATGVGVTRVGAIRRRGILGRCPSWGRTRRVGRSGGMTTRASCARINSRGAAISLSRGRQPTVAGWITRAEPRSGGIICHGHGQTTVAPLRGSGPSQRRLSVGSRPRLRDGAAPRLSFEGEAARRALTTLLHVDAPRRHATRPPPIRNGRQQTRKRSTPRNRSK